MSKTFSKEQRAMARNRLVQARTKASSHSVLDDVLLNSQSNEDVYDILEESEYEHLVQKRREREDFVVDDDGLGYADTGEEDINNGNGDEYAGHGNKRIKSDTGNNTTNAILTQQTLRKVKKNQAATKKYNPNSSDVGKNKSMWDFVNKVPLSHSLPKQDRTNTALGTTSTNRFGGNSSGTSSIIHKSVDELLEQLDDPLQLMNVQSHSSSLLSRNPSRKRNSQRTTRRVVSSRTNHPSRTTKMMIAQRMPSKNNGRPNKYHSNPDDDNNQMNEWNNDDDDDNNNSNINNDDDDKNHVVGLPYEEKSVETENETHELKKVVHWNESTTSDSAALDSNSNQDSTHTVNQSKETESAIQDRPPRRRFTRPKLGQLSKGAAVAAAKAQQMINTEPTIAANQTTALSLSMETSNPHAKSVCDIYAAVETGASTAQAGQMDYTCFLQQSIHTTSDTNNGVKDEAVTSPSSSAAKSSSYMDMYWMDIYERNGDILLFGKVQVPNSKSHNDGTESATTTNTKAAVETISTTTSSFVSTCVLVSGNVRNWFVLPRSGDGDNASASTMMDVHGEINTLLRKENVLPQNEGAGWSGKPVKRNYAFEDGTVPRTKTEYLKVVYDAKYKELPSEEVCQNGGKHFSKILGAGASVLETFIVKRKLMGPCWLRIQNPVPNHAPISWCKVECRVESRKQVTRLDLMVGETNRVPPPPPIVTMSLKLKTVVNNKTHKSEIVSVSAVCHNQVLLETASEESPKYMTQLSLIRPLSQEAGIVAQFPRDIDHTIATHMPQLRRESNERALLSRLMAQIGQWDPDVIVGHNAWGFDLEVLLSRCVEHKVRSWSRIGRRRRTELPNKTHFSARKDMAIADAIAGRLLCDTYLSAKELLRETTYSLTNLAATQLKTTRQEIEPQDIPHWFCESKTIVQLAQSTLFDAHIVQKLMFKLQVLPLTKQLTCIAGNLWSHTLKSNRAERTEYLFLHEFHRLKYLPPEKRRFGKRDPKDSVKSKAKYSGGLVLEPKKGLYDSFILLLDFNSLYPSIIQEYNLCFTTIDWSGYKDNIINEHDEDNNEINISSNLLPPTPDPSIEKGVLPRVIQNLVERRRAVKKLLKSEENPDKRAELDIRQQALKLTANSMYGCLGFSHSRFFAQPIAAMVTAIGRETLQRTVDIAQNTVGLEVIYGDTDSIMINTRINDEKDLAKVKELGERVKKEVNRLYKTLELEIDGIFRSMLLLKKKKYAAKTVLETPDGIKYGQELKGLDLVRRDWCIQSKDTGHFVTDQILSGQDSEVVMEKIYTHLEELAKKMRAGELPLEKYVITKGLSKHPNDYPDGNSQPHVQVAKTMLKNNRAVNTGDHIPYIITAPEQPEDSDKPLAKAASSTERARHPEEIVRSAGALKPDIEWYLTQQILPPISRLCEPIEGVSPQILAVKLGLDSSRFNHFHGSAADVDEDICLDYIPASFLSDDERFKNVEKLKLYCFSCETESCIPGVLTKLKDPDTDTESFVTGLLCPNLHCTHRMHWGRSNGFECYSSISNAMTIWTRGLMQRYYSGMVRCDEPSCALQTRQLSVMGGVCLRRGCNGKMYSVVSERDIHTHLQYLESLFSVDHVRAQFEKKVKMNADDALKCLSKNDLSVFQQLHQEAKQKLDASAFNWISPSFWQNIFDVVKVQ